MRNYSVLWRLLEEMYLALWVRASLALLPLDFSQVTVLGYFNSYLSASALQVEFEAYAPQESGCAP